MKDVVQIRLNDRPIGYVEDAHYSELWATLVQKHGQNAITESAVEVEEFETLLDAAPVMLAALEDALQALTDPEGEADEAATRT